jgi:hypothetical protein
MLAVSACHLKYFTANPAAHRIAELGQESAAIAALKSALGMPLHKERADAVVNAAVMLNAVSFAFVDSRSVSSSWVFSDSSDRLGWLDLQLRFKRLEMATAQFRESAFVKPFDSPTADDQDMTDDESLEGIHPAWQMLLGGKDGPNYDLYIEPVRLLAELRGLEPTCINSFTYFGMVGKLQDGFRDLLFEKDPRALWIFGYWLGLLGRIDIWWCSRRVERDWAAVLSFLQTKGFAQRVGDEGKMWRELIFDLSVASQWPPPETADGWSTGDTSDSSL